MLNQYFRRTLQFTALICLLIACLALIYFVALVFSSPKVAVVAWESNYDIGEYVRTLVFDQGRERVRTPPVLFHSSSNVVTWIAECVANRSGQVGRGLGELSGTERALGALNQILTDERHTLQSAGDRAYHFWETSSIVSIVLGMLTTIIVSLSTTVFGRAEGSASLILRILAIVFPALGTAVAAIIAFYSPQAEWAQASRTAANLTQLHGDMEVSLFRLKCINTENDEAESTLSDNVDKWYKRYIDIQTVAAASSTAPVSSNNPSGAQSGTGSPSLAAPVSQKH